VTHQRHPCRAAAERLDVLLDPAQSCSQIEQSVIARSVTVPAAQKTCAAPLSATRLFAVNGTVEGQYFIHFKCRHSSASKPVSLTHFLSLSYLSRVFCRRRRHQFPHLSVSVHVFPHIKLRTTEARFTKSGTCIMTMMHHGVTTIFDSKGQRSSSQSKKVLGRPKAKKDRARFNLFARCSQCSLLTP